MKISNLGFILSACTAAIATTLVSNSSALSQQPTFFCGTNSGNPATIVQSPQHGDVTLINWKSNRTASSGYDNQTRCNIVSEKFQNFYDQGALKLFTVGKVNRQSVICVVPSKDAPCNKDSMLYTLNPEKDANQQLQQLLDIRTGASTEALEETNGRIYVDYEAFLQEKANEKDNAGLF